MEEIMKIYQMNKSRNHRAERKVIQTGVSGLKKAAGGEDIVTLSAEAINSFSRDNFAKHREQELRELALMHINDFNPEFENLENDHEFVKGERLALLAELVIRVAPAGTGGNIYARVTEFVIEQLTNRE